MNAPDILYFPEFYHYGSTRVGDTTFSYECYDHEDRLLRGDALKNTDNIEEIFFVKSFADGRYPGGGNVSPPVFTKKVLAFTKVDKLSWKEKNMADHSITELTEYPDKITRTDTTTSINRTTGLQQLTIRKYYKVAGAK